MLLFYALRSERDNTIYKGLSNDPDRREGEHNLGKNKSTKNKTPWKLFYVEVCEDRKEARNRELYYKSGAGREILKELLNLIVNPL